MMVPLMTAAVVCTLRCEVVIQVFPQEVPVGACSVDTSGGIEVIVAITDVVLLGGAGRLVVLPSTLTIPERPRETV